MLLNNVERIYEFLDEQHLNTLNNNGIRTVSEFISVEPQRVTALCRSASCEKIPDLKSILRFRKFLFIHHAPCAAGGWHSNRQIKNNILATGIEDIDKVLNGGFKGGLVYEVYGLPGSGRTQLALFVTVNNALCGGNTLYIDTKNDFCIDRFSEILSNTLKPPRHAEKRIKINCDEHEELLERYVKKVRMAKIYDMEPLLAAVSDILNNLDNLTCENDMLPEDWKFYRNIRLLVIDNIASIVLPLLGNDGYNMGDITGLTSQFIEKIRYT